MIRSLPLSTRLSARLVNARSVVPIASARFTSDLPLASQYFQRAEASSTTQPMQEGTASTSIVTKLFNRFSPTAQIRRTTVAERYFAAAYRRAFDPIWYGPGRVDGDYRSRHAMLTMHIWFLHKRLVVQGDTESLAIQEELFELLWHSTKSRIREKGLNELTINKHLNDTQQVSFQHLTHYDHAYEQYGSNAEKRFEELAAIVWIHVLNRTETATDDQLHRMALYIEAQYENIVHACPADYFNEGRIAWVRIPNFDKLRDANTGKTLPPKPIPAEDLLPEDWYSFLNEGGKVYYYNIETNETVWDRPTV